MKRVGIVLLALVSLIPLGRWAIHRFTPDRIKMKGSPLCSGFDTYLNDLAGIR